MSCALVGVPRRGTRRPEERPADPQAEGSEQARCTGEEREEAAARDRRPGGVGGRGGGSSGPCAVPVRRHLISVTSGGGRGRPAVWRAAPGPAQRLLTVPRRPAAGPPHRPPRSPACPPPPRRGVVRTGSCNSAWRTSRAVSSAAVRSATGVQSASVRAAVGRIALRRRRSWQAFTTIRYSQLLTAASWRNVTPRRGARTAWPPDGVVGVLVGLAVPPGHPVQPGGVPAKQLRECVRVAVGVREEQGGVVSGCSGTGTGHVCGRQPPPTSRSLHPSGIRTKRRGR